MSTETATKPSLTLKRRYNASPAKVYAAWIDPQKMIRWMGPEGVQHVSVDIDARIGGTYHISMRGADGQQHDVSGVYRELVPSQKLVFTWAWKSTPERESLVTVLLKPDGDGTILTLMHEQFFDEDARDRHQNGWTGTLAKLEKFLA